MFQIKFVNYLPVHYPLGALQTYDIICELFEYGNERMNTGIPQIDELQTKFSTNILDYSIVDENGNYIVDEDLNYVISTEYADAGVDVGGDNDSIQDEGDDDSILDWSEIDPFSEGFY